MIEKQNLIKNSFYQLDCHSFKTLLTGNWINDEVNIF